VTAVNAVDVEAEIARASALLDEGRIGEAAAAYARCEQLLSNERSPRRAEVLTSLARIARRVGPRESANLLDLALAIFPSHRGALEGRLSIAHELEEHAIAAALGFRAVSFATTDEERTAALDAVARDALRSAASALRTSLQLRPNERRRFDRLRAVHEAAGEYDEAVNVAVAVAEQLGDPVERARAFVDAAELCGDKAANVDRAVALYEAAIADDPQVPGAFDAIEQVLLDSGDVVGTERAYVRQLERLQGRAAVDAEAKLWSKLAEIREDRLADWHGAAEALDRLVTLRPRDENARVRLALLLAEHDEDVLATRALEVAAAIAPKHGATFRALHRVSLKRGRIDRAFNAAAVLVHHEEADEGEQALYRAHAPRVALQPTQAISDGGLALLATEDHDPIVAAIVSSIADAAVAVRIEQLRAGKKLPKLDPRDAQDLEKTTVSAVRSVGWAARFFAMRPPVVYTRPGDPSGIVQLPAPEPTFALGDGVLTGRSVPELAFMLGYELATMRLAGRMIAFYPTLSELKALVVAAIALVIPSELPPEVDALRAAIGPRLDPVLRLKLQNAVRALGERGGQLDVLRYVRALERAASRAGLLACGDLNVAARLIAIDGRHIAGLTAADRVRDLIGFCVSDNYGRVRHALGLAVR
jgi:tetratricopeptide (TPR) repeat protein